VDFPLPTGQTQTMWQTKQHWKFPSQNMFEIKVAVSYTHLTYTADLQPHVYTVKLQEHETSCKNNFKQITRSDA